jgi:hypothetical protein
MVSTRLFYVQQPSQERCRHLWWCPDRADATATPLPITRRTTVRDSLDRASSHAFIGTPGVAAGDCQQAGSHDRAFPDHLP